MFLKRTVLLSNDLELKKPDHRDDSSFGGGWPRSTRPYMKKVGTRVPIYDLPPIGEHHKYLMPYF